MRGKPIRTLLGRLGLTQIRYVSAVRRRGAPDLVGRVYGEVTREFGILPPPVALHAPSPPVLAATWLMLRETLIVTGQVQRAAKEAVATAVSMGNTCPFCFTVHDKTLSELVGPVGLLAGTDGRLSAPEVAGAAAWARDVGTKESALRHQPACRAGNAPELIGTAVLLHYLNRMVNVFLVDVPLPPGVPRPALGCVMRIIGGMIRNAALEPHPPGASLDMLPAATLPDDLAWAAGRPVVADAFARACQAVDAAGVRSVPVVVRDVVTAELAGWRGEPRGPSRAWAESIVADLPPGHRAAGRVALLTALASHQIDSFVIDQFRQDDLDDAGLIELTAWASLAAARRVGAWIPVGTPEADTVAVRDGV
jgi:hypothetical protein